MGAKPTREFSEEEVNHFAEATAFEAADILLLLDEYRKVHKDGKPLNRGEFKKLIASLAEQYPHPAFTDDKQLMRAFSIFDTDHGGKVSVEEVVFGLDCFCNGTLEQKADLAFRAYDTDGDGVLSRVETRKLIAEVWRATKQIVHAEIEREKQRMREEGELPGFPLCPMNVVYSKSILSTATHVSFKQHILEGDMNQDGVISKEEWIAACQRSDVFKYVVEPATLDEEKIQAISEELGCTFQ
mmetsp:Transcript_32597/g.91296  ORF Transcript_32597/g.91296 Transcript_32597/m.91296 type:complete len:242 (+) Transcript_32597:71-796(+)